MITRRDNQSKKGTVSFPHNLRASVAGFAASLTHLDDATNDLIALRLRLAGHSAQFAAPVGPGPGEVCVPLARSIFSLRENVMHLKSIYSNGCARHVVQLSLALLLEAVSQAAYAQSPAFTFTKIVDPGQDSVNCVGINNPGRVIVTIARSAPGVFPELWRGDGQTFTQVSSDVVSICASINDLDETAYVVQSPTPVFSHWSGTPMAP